MANWFESLGLKPGPFHALMVTVTELAHPGRCWCSGSSPRSCYGGVCALMLVAFLTNHLKNGFFLEQRQGGLRVRRDASRCSRSRSAPLGPGEWSLDHAFDFAFPFDPKKALLITAIVGIGGAARVPRRVLAAAEEGPTPAS